MSVSQLLSLCFLIPLMGIVACQPEKKQIVFFGDSITQAGNEPGGYIDLMRQQMDTSRYELIGAGISGNKVPDLQGRVQEDVLSQNPDIVLIYIGINDVWHFYKFEGTTGTEKSVYEAGLKDLIQTITSTGSEVILATPTVIGEDPDSQDEANQRLVEYAEVVRQVAQETNTPLCDLRANISEYLRENNSSQQYQGILTNDGVHMNKKGNQFLADQFKACIP
ncbi:MAG: GDSL-type esterase/lipase family protein [Bacteroidota bacterium]